MSSEQRVPSKHKKPPGKQPEKSPVTGIPPFKGHQSQGSRAVLTSPQKTEGYITAFEKMQFPSPLFSAFTFICTFLQIVLNSKTVTPWAVGEGGGDREGV